MAEAKKFKISAQSARSPYRRAGIAFGVETVKTEVTEDQLKKLEADKYIKIISKEELTKDKK